jgi:hypothetical protein
MPLKHLHFTGWSSVCSPAEYGHVSLVACLQPKLPAACSSSLLLHVSSFSLLGKTEVHLLHLLLHISSCCTSGLHYTIADLLLSLLGICRCLVWMLIVFFHKNFIVGVMFCTPDCRFIKESTSRKFMLNIICRQTYYLIK